MSILSQLNSVPMYLICGGIIAFVAVVCVMCVGCTGKRKAQPVDVLAKETPPAVQSPEVTDDTLAAEEPDTETSTDIPPQPVAMVLEPVVRDIPVGRPLSADSLYMHTEYDYYPVATSKVKVFITSRANREYDSGEGYSLVYYNEALKQWEPQPTNPIINDVLWVFTPDYPTDRQTIQFYTDKNRPGRYRIYKSFNRNTCTAYAEFELVSKAQHRKLLDKISQYGKEHPKDRVIENLNTSFFRDNDTLYMSWMVNSEALQKEFRQKVLNYAAIVVNDGKEDVATYFTQPMCTDTFGIKMYTEKAVYPLNTESVAVRIVNRSGRSISMGSPYRVLRKEGEKWLSLPRATVWTLEERILPSNKIYPFSASLYTSLRMLTPGIYRVVKKMDIGDNYHDWYFAAEFRIGHKVEERDASDKEPSSKPLQEVAEEKDLDIAYDEVEEMPEFPGGMSALMDFIRKNLNYDKSLVPETVVIPRVIVQFVIDEEGNIIHPVVLRGVNPALDEEALRVVKLMPKWKPGRQSGKPEKVRYAIPVTFERAAKVS